MLAMRKVKYTIFVTGYKELFPLNYRNYPSMYTWTLLNQQIPGIYA